MKENKLSLFLLIVNPLNPVTISYGQMTDKINPINFEMSSLKDKVFIATGFYKGELQIYKDFIELNIN